MGWQISWSWNNLGMQLQHVENRSRNPISLSTTFREEMENQNRRSYTSATLHCESKVLLAWEPFQETRQSLDESYTPTYVGRELSTVPLSHNLNTGEGAFKEEGEGGRGEEGVNRNFIIPIPREATSVATMIGLLPALNSFKTQSLSCCCLSPWIAKTVVSYLNVAIRR
jgi:hypothetical protein